MKKILLLSFTSLFFIMAHTQTTVQVGDLFQNNMMTGYTVPLYRVGNPSTGQQLYSRHFFVYPQDDLCKAQLSPGATITKLAWFKSGGSAADATHEFKIYMKNSEIISRNGDTWTNLIDGATKVFESNALVISAEAGWWEITFTTPFVYTGKSIEIYTDWFVGGGPNGSRTTGRIQFGQTTRSAGIDIIRLSGGSAKFNPFTDDEFVGGDLFTANVTSDMVNVKLTQTGGIPRTEICNNGVDDDCDGLVDEGCPTDYQSRTTGNWNLATSWRRFVNDGFGFRDALVPPTHSDLTVQMISPHTLTLNTTNSIDQLTIASGSRLTIASPGILNLNNGTGDDIINNGTIDMQANSRINGEGSILNNAVMTVNTSIIEAPVVNKSSITFTDNNAIGLFTNDATTTWSSGTLSAAATFTNSASGTFIIGSDNSFNVGTLDNKGAIRKTSSGITTINGAVNNTSPNGIIRAVGTLNITGSFANTGFISPGINTSTIGTLTLNSPNNAFSAASTLFMELQSAAGAGIGHDLLARDGSLILQGKLTVTELAAVPSGTYEIIHLNTGSVSGSFATVTLPPGYVLEVRATSVVIIKPAAEVSFPGSGNGIKFNGINSVAAAPGTSNINFGINQDFTIDCWVRIPVIGQQDLTYTENVIIEKWGPPFANALPFSLCVGNSTSTFDGKIVFYRGNGAERFGFFSSVAVNDGRYHHVAIQKDGTLLKIFIDGIFAGQTTDRTTGETLNNNSLYFGSSQDISSSLNGEVDEIRIWNTAVPEDLIRTWMCKKVTSVHPSFDNLVSYYPFDQSNTSTGFLDTKGTSHGTLFNSAALAISGAPVGSASAFSYAATPSATLAIPGGEKMTATSAPSTLTGIHVYLVDDIPNTTNGIVGIGGNNKYFGVHTVGSSSPVYTGVYEYTNNPLVSNEASLKLFKRNANDATLWEQVAATQNSADNTFTFTGNFTEYMLGSIGTPLPLTLLQFTGTKQATTHLLQWKTTNEQNTREFVIERSTDAARFTPIGTKKAAGSGSNDYSYTDAAITQGGTFFYRLKMGDRDGRYTYSPIIKLSHATHQPITIFPNPVKDVLTISGLQQKGTIRLLDTDGKLLQQQTVTAQTSTINMSNYAKGIYVLKYSFDDEEVIKKIIKQ